MPRNAFRKEFARGLIFGLRVVWPILSILLALVVGLGVVIGLREGWSLGESIYFAFVTALTIGYGDFSPKTMLARFLAVVIGICGILITAVVAAIAVKALNAVSEQKK